MRRPPRLTEVQQITRSFIMDSLKPLLKNLISVEGILAAVVIGKDGFVIESLTNTDLDTDAVGGIISGGIRNTEEMGKDLGVGTLHQSMIEYENGILLSKVVTESGTLLAIVASDKALVGNVRYQLNKFGEQIAKNLA
ncbi:MAG: roadblock/LC7 domain-containing protein [Bacteroidetes bacterium]|nr:roadblock/LC7 domain-containing protein [Bacteroidota bacterium]